MQTKVVEFAEVVCRRLALGVRVTRVARCKGHGGVAGEDGGRDPADRPDPGGPLQPTCLRQPLGAVSAETQHVVARSAVSTDTTWWTRTELLIPPGGHRQNYSQMHHVVARSAVSTDTTWWTRTELLLPPGGLRQNY